MPKAYVRTVTIVLDVIRSLGNALMRSSMLKECAKIAISMNITK